MRVLFDALIFVEGSAAMFARELELLQARVKDEPGLEGFKYVAPPKDDADDEVRRAVEARREALRRSIKFVPSAKDRRRLRYLRRGEELELRAPHWYVHDWFDSYHRLERHFRKDLDRARNAAIDAAGVLDGSGDGPFDRTSTKIRENIQSLGGCVPPPIVHGDFPPMDPGIPTLLRTHLPPITTWIDKLRAFVHPRIPLAGGRSGAPVALRKRRDAPKDLTESYEEVLLALHELGAVDKGHRKPAREIAEKAYGAYDPTRVKNVLADLSRWELVSSLRGRHGGSWLSENGMKRFSGAAGP